MLITVKGLVIRETPVGDFDKMLTVLTAEHGKISIFAKGSKKLKSPAFVCSQMFCYAEFVLRKTTDVYYINDCSLVEGFFDIRNTLEGSALASYIAEVLNDVATAVPDKNLMRLALNSLFAIASGKYNLALVKGAFEIRCLSILGFMPDVHCCASCLGRSADYFFDIMGGEIECADCRHSRALTRSDYDSVHEARIICQLTEGARAALEYSIHAPIEKIFSFNVSDEDMRLFSRAAEEYILNQLERSFRSLEFYKEVVR